MDRINAENFMHLQDGKYRRNRMNDAAKILNSALDSDQISPTQLKEAKDLVNRTLEAAWDNLQFDELYEERRNLAWGSPVYQLTEEITNRVEAHTLKGRLKKLNKLVPLTEAQAFALDKTKETLELFMPVVEAIDYLKGKVVKRVFKTEEEKRAEKLVPRTPQSAAVLNAVNEVIEQRRPEIVQRFITHTRDRYEQLREKYGVSLIKEMMTPNDQQSLKELEQYLPYIRGPYLSGVSPIDYIKQLEQKLENEPDDANWLNNIIHRVKEYMEMPRLLDEDKLNISANKYVDDLFDAVRAKMMEKAGPLENPKVASLSGYEFHLTGTVDNKPVHIEQQVILNISVHGKVFNQFPARITLDGKSVSEAEYKTEILALEKRHTNNEPAMTSDNDDSPSP